MSTLNSVSNSSGTSSASQLAQTSSLERSLYNLGNAIQNGNLTSAGSILTSLINANPQYSTTSSSTSSSGDSTQSGNSINQEFQNLANAISANQPDTARNVWAQLKSSLAKDGVSTTSSGADLAAQATAQAKISAEQSLVSDLFGGSSDGSSLVSTLLGGSSTSSDSVSSALSNWLTYQANGSVSNTSNGSQTQSGLDTLA